MITSICVMAMFSSGIICNADELNSAIAVANKKSLPSVTTSTTTSVTTSVTTSETMTTTYTETTIPEVTTPVETTTCTSLETTSQVTTQNTTDTSIQESLITPTVMELPTSNLQPITMLVSDDLLLKLPYNERIVFLQSKIEDYLYNNSANPNETLEKVQTYLKSICINAELNSKEVLF